MERPRPDQSRRLAPIFSKKRPSLLAHPNNTRSMNDKSSAPYSVRSTSRSAVAAKKVENPGSNNRGQHVSQNYFSSQSAVGGIRHQTPASNDQLWQHQTPLQQNQCNPTQSPWQPLHDQWQQPCQPQQNPWQPQQDPWQPQQNPWQPQQDPWQPQQNPWQSESVPRQPTDSSWQPTESSWQRGPPYAPPWPDQRPDPWYQRSPNDENKPWQQDVARDPVPWQQKATRGTFPQQQEFERGRTGPSANNLTQRAPLSAFSSSHDQFRHLSSYNSMSSPDSSTVGKSWASTSYGVAPYTPRERQLYPPTSSFSAAASSSHPITTTSTLPTDKPQAVEPTANSTSVVKVQPVKKGPDTSLRILSATVQGLRHWTGQKQKLTLLFEIIGRINSAVSPVTNSAKEFVLKDDKEHSVTCIFFEMDRSLPRLIRGQYYRCMGSLASCGDKFRCISIRPATEAEVKLHPVNVVAADKTMRSLVCKTREI